MKNKTIQFRTLAWVILKKNINRILKTTLTCLNIVNLTARHRLQAVVSIDLDRGFR